MCYEMCVTTISCTKCLCLSLQAAANKQHTACGSLPDECVGWIQRISESYVARQIAFEYTHQFFCLSVWAVLIWGRQLKRESPALQNSKSRMAAFYQKGHGRTLQLGAAAGFCFSWTTSPAGTPTATAVAEFKSWLHQFRKPHGRLKEHDE